MVFSWRARSRSSSSGSRRMPRERVISPRMVLISFSDFLPKFLVLSRSDSVFWTSSAMRWILAVLRQFEARTDSPSSATFRKRCSLRSLRTTGSAPVSPPGVSAGAACGKSISSANWSSRMRRGVGHGRLGGHTAVGPELHGEPLVGARRRHGSLHMEVHALDRREVGVHRYRVDRQGLRLTLLRRLVATPPLPGAFPLPISGLVGG